MSVEIVIIDAVLFRYILICSPFISPRARRLSGLGNVPTENRRKGNKSFSFFDNIRKKVIWPLKRLCFVELLCYAIRAFVRS